MAVGNFGLQRALSHFASEQRQHSSLCPTVRRHAFIMNGARQYLPSCTRLATVYF